MTVSATIDQAHGEPDRRRGTTQDAREEVLERRWRMPRDDHRAHRRGDGSSVRSAAWSTPAVAPGVAAQEPPAGEHARRDEPVLPEASIAYCEQLGWYLQVPARRQERRTYAATPRRAAMPMLARPLTRQPSRAPRHLLDEPLVAARLGRLGDARPRDEDVVAAGAGTSAPSSRHVSRSWRLSRLRVTAGPTDLRHREAEPRHAVRVVLAREPVQGQIARRDRTALTVDGIEVPRAGQAVPALHGAARSGGEALAAPRAAALQDRAGRRASTCGRENRACACGAGRWAGRCVSRSGLGRGGPRARRAARASSSIDEAARTGVFHSAARPA